MTTTTHCDPRIADILDIWNVKRQDAESRAARRMFRTLEEMREFFQIAYPGSSFVGAAGYVHGHAVNGYGMFDCLHVMRSMDAIRAGYDDIEVAAYLAYAEDVHYSGTDNIRDPSGPGILPEEVGLAQEFLARFHGRSADELRKAFGRESWRANDMVVWVASCFDRGVPADYLNPLARGEYARYYLEEWTPELLARLHSEGVPAAYIARYWSRAAEFDKMMADGIPYEYALILDDGVTSRDVI